MFILECGFQSMIIAYRIGQCIREKMIFQVGIWLIFLSDVLDLFHINLFTMLTCILLINNDIINVNENKYLLTM